MAFYPVMLDLRGKECLVVGGGRIAMHKVISLLRAEASVTVVAIEFDKHFFRLKSLINMVERPFSEQDIKPAISLVIGATNSSQINKSISERASALNIPCNIVDCPERCSFIVPAVVRRGDITIAISTGGASPRLSRHIKSHVAKTIGSDYTRLASYLAEIRKTVRMIISEQHVRSEFWESLFTHDPIEYINAHGWPEFRKYTERLIDDFKKKADAE